MSNSDHTSPEKAVTSQPEAQGNSIFDPFGDPCAFVCIGDGIIGWVDEVHGPESAQLTVPISRFEAKVLVQHWLEAAEEIERDANLLDQMDSSEMRRQCYAWRRVKELIDAGLLTNEEAREIDDRVWSAQAEEWEYIRSRDAARNAGSEAQEEKSDVGNSDG